MTLSEAQQYFEELRYEIHTIFCLVSDFDSLFPTDGGPQDPVTLTDWRSEPTNRQILESVALRFFGDLNSMMHEHYVLKLARLGDPASTKTKLGEKKNLTISGMQLFLRHLGRTTAEVERLARDLADFIESSAKRARNELIAHSDWDTRKGGLTVGGASDEQTQAFHVQLQEYCDTVARQLDLDPCQLIGSSQGDARDLMRALKWVLKIRITCTDAACPFQRYDIRPVRGTP